LVACPGNPHRFVPQHNLAATNIRCSRPRACSQAAIARAFPIFAIQVVEAGWGTTAALNQDRTAIYHNDLPGAESFLHQEQIGLRYVMSLADSANRETLAHAFE
jgi:hypothetical protein